MIRLAVRVERSSAELVLAELLELAPGGVEEVDQGSHVEYALYGAPGELPSLPALKAAAVAGGALVDIHTSEVADDWSERWRSFHRPVLVAPPSSPGAPSQPPVPAIRIRPPWEPAEAFGSDVLEVVIDPAQAFGTGAHFTTRLCLQLLLELACERPAAGPLLDVGCGSGVLAIVACKLGYGPVVALDNDPLSVQATRENAVVNEVKLDVRKADLRGGELPLIGDRGSGEEAPVVVCNLLRGLLLELAAVLEHPPPQLIASGLLEGEGEEVAGAFSAALGMRTRQRAASGGWEALWLEGPGGP